MEIAAKHLGEFRGLCACYKKTTMNGRDYNRIFEDILAGKNYRFNEMMRRGGVLCEFGHPAQFTADFERTETDPEKAAVLIKDIEEGEEGNIYATGIILNTPAGITYKAIAPFYNFGFSSRGSYEADESANEGPDGWNQDTYVFKGFDIVALPANEGSEISAVEGIKSGGKKRFKSARESLDLNNIADANNIDKKEVEAELDKLFDENGNLAPVELINSREFSGVGTSALAPEAPEQVAPMELSDKEAPKDDTSPNTLLLDLHKVLSQKSELEGQIQKLLFSKAEGDAAIISLGSQIQQLTKIKEEAENKIRMHEDNREEIKALLEKLTANYDSYSISAEKDLTTYKQAAEVAGSRAESLASMVSKAKAKIGETTSELTRVGGALQKAEEALKVATEENRALKTANEGLSGSLSTEAKEKKRLLSELTAVKSSLESYKKEMRTASENLIGVYSSVYSVDKRAIITRLGSLKATPENIKRAAEALSNDTYRLAAYSTRMEASKGVVEKRERIVGGDELEKELFSALQQEGYLKED